MRRAAKTLRGQRVHSKGPEGPWGPGRRHIAARRNKGPFCLWIQGLTDVFTYRTGILSLIRTIENVCYRSMHAQHLSFQPAEHNQPCTQTVCEMGTTSFTSARRSPAVPGRAALKACGQW